MDILSNKVYNYFDYFSRYADTPVYFNTVDKREICGIGLQLSKDTSYVLHKVESTDNLDYLALKYYNNPTYWWVIAYFNDIYDAFIPLLPNYTTLRIPNIASVKFKEDR